MRIYRYRFATNGFGDNGLWLITFGGNGEFVSARFNACKMLEAGCIGSSGFVSAVGGDDNIFERLTGVVILNDVFDGVVGFVRLFLLRWNVRCHFYVPDF